MDIKEKIEELRAELHRHNYNYYVLNAPEISDKDFDDKMRELQDLEQAYPEYRDENSPTMRVGSDINKNFTQVAHKYPMLSLANTYSEGEVTDFYERVRKALNEDFEICCEMKYDGTSISLTYEDGKLLRAVTRGDGEKGDDVTDNVKTIRSIPLVLHGDNYPSSFEIRGEILMPWEVFEELNREKEAREEPLFANPRNAASGTLKLQNSSVVASRKLDAYLYYLLGDKLPCDGHYENLQEAAKWGFKISDLTRKCQTLEEVFDFINYWDVERKNLPVATDGIVLKVNSLRQQKNLGFTAKSPRWAIAYKFQAERALTRLNMVTYQVGRTGAVTPVANLDAVQLSGTIVKRASLHNADIIEGLDLHIGDMVYVEKGGEIIPKITGVDKDARSFMLGEKVRFITNCPECGSKLIRYEGEAAHYCPNETACPPQIKGKIEHFISRKAMNIDGLGPETVDMFYRLGLIHNTADLYELTADDIKGLDRMGEKSAENIITGIAQSKTVPFERVIFALGIRFVGETVAKKIAKSFENIDELRQLVQPRLAQEGAEACAAVVAAFGPFWPVLFRIRAHGTELADQKRLAVFPEALLPVDRPARRIQRDDRGDDPHGDGQHDQREQCKGKIKAALEDQITTARLYLRKLDVYWERFIGCFRDRPGKCCRHAASSPSFSFSRFLPLCAFRITDRAIRSLRKTLPRRFRSFAEYATQ